MSKIAEYTNLFVNKMPYWTKIKKNPSESIGEKFLNVFGLEYDDMRYILDYSFEQMFINKMDVNYLNKAYKICIPPGISYTDIKYIRSNSVILTQVDTLVDFFDITYGIYDKPQNFQKDVYLIDTEREIIYTKYKYDVSDNYKYGKLTLVTNDYEEYELPIYTHYVWNFFDELGLLLNLKRIDEEDNLSYKERLLNVFKYKQNSSKTGMLNAISNELGLRKTVIWKDTTKDLIIKDPMIVISEIEIHNRFINKDDVIFINNDGYVVLKHSDMYLTDVEVSYTTGVELHSLSDKDDFKIQSELFNLDGTSTKLLNKYFNRIHSISPIIWDRFVWDKAYLDVTDKDIGGIAYIPNLMDGKINGFKDYHK